MNTQALHQNASPLSEVEQNSDDELRDIAARATEVLTDLNQKLWARFAADAAGEQFSWPPVKRCGRCERSTTS